VKISATIITFNEEAKIADAVASVNWADELLVVDSGSTDRTCEIAEGLGARVIRRDWPGFAAQKQFAVDEAANDVIFSLDADERVSDALREEILALKALEELPRGGYRVPRMSVYMGREIRHGGWYPDRQLRLFDRRKARWKDVVIHESVEMATGEEPGLLKGDIIHYSVEGPREHMRMIAERYAPLGARKMYESGRRATLLSIAFAGPGAFLKDYVFKAGFLDGVPGLCIALLAGQYTSLKHMLLYEMQRSGDSGETGPAT